ncbi:MAG TPA: hypothetical protein VMR34_01810 [Candidatus Saccharimonadales bacterium]|nr:hypothetical protein [Candidatus Saccharimonadales bacterium]
MTYEHQLGGQPLSFRFYDLMLDLLGKHTETLRRELGRKYIEYSGAQAKFIPLVARPQPLVLESLGSNTLSTGGILFEFRGRQTGTDVSSDDEITISLGLFRDGLPFTADEDSDVAGLYASNAYQLYLSREIPPTAIQLIQCRDFHDTRGWASANKHVLSEDDCVALISFIQHQEIDILQYG